MTDLQVPVARVRRAILADADAVAELAQLTFPLACPPGSDPRDVEEFCRSNLTAAHFAEHLLSPLTTVLVAEPGAAEGDDGRAETGRLPLIAYALLVWTEAPPPTDGQVPTPTVMLSKCYAHPDAHGTGAASALVEAVVAEAAARSVRSVWLGVNQQNVRAQRFYAKNGFTVVGTKHMVVGSQTHDDFVMCRTVTS
ncbi:ribosomal protein S18 acetylase RimI-like enzyme [Flavimobilis soli]|uniref:Ribosomal protein S18 acetylase RimI-like enzyme n=1 Tax=Flavimobilis soli TaxID=442709 RepID=A0A2A9EAD6_9MICO|nr:GNAT family N-acetyltransferase [Flavimobilis soli]PFG35773.1 ribosomal protein S18 acetylase RimI-like enzyme [Flavimobilis soli]